MVHRGSEIGSMKENRIGVMYRLTFNNGRPVNKDIGQRLDLTADVDTGFLINW